MKFAELLSALAEAGASEDGYPETMLGDIQSAHDTETGGATAKIGQLEEALKLTTAELETTKAHNYDLLQSVPNDSGGGSDDADTLDPEPNEDDETDIDDLFEDKE